MKVLCVAGQRNLKTRFNDQFIAAFLSKFDFLLL